MEKLDKLKFETFGGVCCIGVALGCLVIGVRDYQEQLSWFIWAVMFVVLLINGIAMMRHARPLKVLKVIEGPKHHV